MNVWGSRKPLHSHTQGFGKQHPLPISLSNSHPFIPGQSPWFIEVTDNILLDKFLLIILLGASWGGILTHSCIFVLLICTVQPFNAGYTQATVMFYVNCTSKICPGFCESWGKMLSTQAKRLRTGDKDNCSFCLSSTPSLSVGNGPLSC